MNSLRSRCLHLPTPCGFRQMFLLWTLGNECAVSFFVARDDGYSQLYSSVFWSHLKVLVGVVICWQEQKNIFCFEKQEPPLGSGSERDHMYFSIRTQTRFTELGLVWRCYGILCCSQAKWKLNSSQHICQFLKYVSDSGICLLFIEEPQRSQNC